MRLPPAEGYVSLVLLELDPAKLIQLKICCQGARVLGYVVLRVARPGGISRDQGPRVSTCYEWQGLKEYKGTRAGLGIRKICWLTAGQPATQIWLSGKNFGCPFGKNGQNFAKMAPSAPFSRFLAIIFEKSWLSAGQLPQNLWLSGSSFGCPGQPDNQYTEPWTRGLG